MRSSTHLAGTFSDEGYVFCPHGAQHYLNRTEHARAWRDDSLLTKDGANLVAAVSGVARLVSRKVTTGLHTDLRGAAHPLYDVSYLWQRRHRSRPVSMNGDMTGPVDKPTVRPLPSSLKGPATGGSLSASVAWQWHLPPPGDNLCGGAGEPDQAGPVGVANWLPTPIFWSGSLQVSPNLKLQPTRHPLAAASSLRPSRQEILHT